MRLKLPPAPSAYSPSYDDQRNRLIEAFATGAYVKGEDVGVYQPAKLIASDVSMVTTDTHTPEKGSLSWNSDDETLDIGMDYGVVQQVGMETYARVQNNTGVTIPNAAVVGFAGVGAGNELAVAPYLADGSTPTLYILGVMTHDLPDTGEVGYCTTWGHVRNINTTGSSVGETWAVGDILYASPSSAGKFTKVKPTAPDNVVPLAAVLKVSATIGEIFVRPTIEQQFYYGQFSKTTDVSPAAANTAYAITFDNTEITNGVSIGSPASRIVVTQSGLYNFSANFQIQSGSSSAKTVWFWFRKNGTDVVRSAYLLTSNLNNGYLASSRDDFFSLDAGDYIEFMWAADDTNVTLKAAASTAFAPAGPSCILSVTQVQQ
jgi:hypothetical protein